VGATEQPEEIHQHSGWVIPLAFLAVIAILSAIFLLYDLRPGIGPKVAGRIVLELAGKLVPHGTGSGAAPETAIKAEWKPQVVAAMTSLGWSEKDATGSIDKAMADSPELVEAGNVAQILRATLRWLGQDGARAGNRVGSRG